MERMHKIEIGCYKNSAVIGVFLIMHLLLHLFFNHNYNIAYGILGGYEIKMKETPYQVNYGDVCGGVLIHQKWALTTAHCGYSSRHVKRTLAVKLRIRRLIGLFGGMSTEYDYIRTGNRHRLRGPKVKIHAHMVHPNYRSEHEFDYDVQLLEVRRRLYFDKQVNCINISDGGIGHSIFVSGWGYQEEKGDYADTLHQVELYVVPMKKCQNIKKAVYNHTLTERMFCAVGKGRDACQGDSGGPAVSLGQLVGLSSFGFGCGRGIPGVYVNVSNKEISEWIHLYTGI